MKKVLFLILIYFCMIINVNAKSTLVMCYYDKTKIESSTYVKAKVVLYSDKTIKWSFMNSSGQYNNGTYGKVQAYNESGKKVSTPYASFAQSNNFYAAYESFSKKCPNIKVSSKTDSNSYQFKAVNKSDNSTSSLISKSTKQETGGSTSNNDTSKDYYECSRNITSKDLDDVVGTTLYFRLYKLDGKKEFCVRTKNTSSDGVIPCKTVKNSSDASLSTTDNGTSYIFTIKANDISNIWSNISNDNTKFTCPNDLYAGLMTNDSNVKGITISTKKEDLNGAITTAKISQGENEELNGGSKYTVLKPGIKVSVDVDKEGCNILGDDLTKWLQWLLDVIRISGLSLAILLGILDFLKAISSKDYDMMKTANKNFSTRLLSLALLFLVPTFIDLILSFLSISVTGDNPTCGVN